MSSSSTSSINCLTLGMFPNFHFLICKTGRLNYMIFKVHFNYKFKQLYTSQVLSFCSSQTNVQASSYKILPELGLILYISYPTHLPSHPLLSRYIWASFSFYKMPGFLPPKFPHVLHHYLPPILGVLSRVKPNAPFLKITNIL